MNDINSITLQAPAKINLALDVIRRLPNGYHELRMIMQTVSLYDEITVEKKINEPGIHLTTIGTIPDLTDEKQNIVYKAAQTMMDKYSIQDGIHITLKKNIPAAAGLAGGSTDCATTLIAINTLWNLSLSEKELCDIGVTLGADVPYCIMKGTALAEGIGEKLTPLPALPAYPVILVKPNVNISTKQIYESLTITKNTIHPDINGMISAIETQNLPEICFRLRNVLENVTRSTNPAITEIKNYFSSMGAKGSLMSGSGPTVFAIFDTMENAQEAFEKIQRKYPSYNNYLVTLC